MAEQSNVKRPTHRTVSMWADLRMVLANIHEAEFLLGFHPEKPRGYDFEAIQVQLQDARARLGELALALAEEDL